MGLQKPASSVMRTKAVADVVFCFDCTGSMSDCIGNVKEHVSKFVEGLNADQSVTIDWRMRALGYGDIEIGEEVQNDNDFVSDVAGATAAFAGVSFTVGWTGDAAAVAAG